MKLSRLVVPVVVALGLGTLGTAATTAHAAPTKPAAPVKADRYQVQKAKPLLAKPTRGKAALHALGSNLAVAAQRNGMSAAALRTLLSSDPTAAIYPSGDLAYVDTFTATPTNNDPTPQSLIVPVGQTFQLESRPGSKHTIYLNFLGANVSNTGWNGTKDGEIPNTFYAPFSLDSTVNTTFSNAEYEYIQEVWREVSETYATFDVNVTTKDPGAAAYNRSGPTDQTYGDMVLFTNDTTSNPICEPAEGCGGVAFVGGFDDVTDNANLAEPAWVRSRMQTGPTTFENLSAFETAMAASHEIGHTLGLHHDGTTTPKREYYAGQGVWTPIMGSGEGAVHQFSNGDYKFATNHEDDFAVMASHGLPKLPDDAGNTLATANTLGAINYTSAAPLRGVIGDRSDVDVYKIGPCTTTPTVQVKGTGVGSALDIAMGINNGDGSIFGRSDPSTAGYGDANPNPGLDAGAFTAPTGSAFYLSVDGVGNGDPSSKGYSDYGSVGSYTLTVTNCVAANGAVPAAPGNVQLTNTKASGTVSWTGVAGATGYRVSGIPGTGTFEVPAGTTSKNVTVNGGYDATISVVALNANGASAPATLTQHVSSWAPTTPPSIKITNLSYAVGLDWAPGANPGGAVLYAWRIKEGSKTLDLAAGDFRDGVLLRYTGYGTRKLLVQPLMKADDNSVAPSRTISYYISGTPGRPAVGAASGRAGGAKTATAKWVLRNTGGVAPTHFRVIAYKLNKKGKVASHRLSPLLSPKLRAYSFKLAAGKYRFKVVAYNKWGASPASAYSKVVTAR